jgi:hypothetical protein
VSGYDPVAPEMIEADDVSVPGTRTFAGTSA